MILPNVIILCVFNVLACVNVSPTSLFAVSYTIPLTEYPFVADSELAVQVLVGCDPEPFHSVTILPFINSLRLAVCPTVVVFATVFCKQTKAVGNQGFAKAYI